MKTNRAWFILSACLLSSLLAGWLIAHRYANPTVATPPGQAVSRSVPAAEAVVNPTPQRESPREVQAEPPQPTPEIQQAGTEPAITSSHSPGNSQDLEQNRDWARSFPAEALAWLTNAPDGSQRDTVAEIVFPQLAQTNAAAAVVLAENCLGEDPDQAAQGLLASLAQTWAGQDWQAASTWALAKPAGEQRDRLLQRIALVAAKTDPAEAGRLISEQMAPGQIQNEAAISVLYQWSRQDAVAALAWAESFSPGDLRERAINEVKNVSAVSVQTP
jgi:hypothetical protein